MAINVKVLERPIEDVSYVRAALKGMALTFKHLDQSGQGDGAVSGGARSASPPDGAGRTGC